MRRQQVSKPLLPASDLRGLIRWQLGLVRVRDRLALGVEDPDMEPALVSVPTMTCLLREVGTLEPSPQDINRRSNPSHPSACARKPRGHERDILILEDRSILHAGPGMTYD